MATKPFIPFSVQFIGDGSDVTFNVNMTTGPVVYSPAANGFAFATTLGLPSGVSDLSVAGPTALTVSSSSYSLGTVSVTLSGAPDAGGKYLLSGIAEY